MTAERDTDERGDDPRDRDAREREARTGVFVVSTDAERRDAFSIRREVFVDEQGVDEDVEWDEHDEPGADATHFVAYDDGDVVGAARFRAVDRDPGRGPNAGDADESATGKVERVVVAADRRGEDWGRRVMNAVESHAREEGFDRLELHAQTPVRGFYETLGYEAYGDKFEEAGIPHVKMAKRL
ncbi:GNAT family N-acetyltransferase [Halobellus limi]|uniref:GNAT family N-acetyltransferase n=1 Tax=Halobellus limi TaxID=699433 RepID=A0A1H6AKQ1_9EURY|nr:GNAT family N-acetyltransferase [Halobellus limi]SEG49313.1 Predicted N-acyltransferase, GNAT family [Halobellus limi]